MSGSYRSRGYRRSAQRMRSRRPTHPRTEGRYYRRMDDRESPHHQYRIFDVDIYGISFRTRSRYERGYQNWEASSTSCLWSRYRESYLYVRQKSPRRWKDCKELYLAPRRSHHRYFSRKPYGTDIWLARTRFERWMARTLSPSYILWSFDDTRILTYSDSRSSAYCFLSERTSQSSFSLPLELSRRYNRRKIGWSICRMAPLRRWIYPYRITLDASLLKYFCRCDIDRCRRLCRWANPIISYRCISSAYASFLVLWALGGIPPSVYFHDTVITLYQRITSRKTSLGIPCHVEERDILPEQDFS